MASLIRKIHHAQDHCVSGENKSTDPGILPPPISFFISNAIISDLVEMGKDVKAFNRAVFWF